MSDDSFPSFAWAIGEEGSDPVVMRDGQPYRHDQYAASGHYGHQAADLADIAACGARVVRYGMPWRTAEPSPGSYDWTHWDRALGSCADVGLVPVVDLLHFGLPDHYPGFSDPSWIDGFARYVDAFLRRFSEPKWFTPVNEPGITALMSARFGAWNDRLAAAADHARVLANIVLANLEALARVRADRDGWWIGSEGFDVPVAITAEAEPEADRRRALGWLVWDLHLGRDPLPSASTYLDPVDRQVLRRIRSFAAADRTIAGHTIAGHDLYPTSVRAIGGPAPEWSTPDLVDLGVAELRRWHDRYGLPFWVAETSNLSLPVDQQVPWLDSLAAALQRERAAGLPVRGLCWYSRGDQFDWQTALLDPVGAVTEVGLFDAQRRPRPVAARFAELARG